MSLLMMVIFTAILAAVIFLRPRDREMLEHWADRNGLRVLRVEPLVRSFTFKYGMYSQAQRFVGVVAIDASGRRRSVVLRSGNVLLGTRIAEIKLCEDTALPEHVAKG